MKRRVHVRVGRQGQVTIRSSTREVDIPPWDHCSHSSVASSRQSRESGRLGYDGWGRLAVLHGIHHQAKWKPAEAPACSHAAMSANQDGLAPPPSGQDRTWLKVDPPNVMSRVLRLLGTIRQPWPVGRSKSRAAIVILAPRGSARW